MRLTIAYSKIKKRNLVLIDNDTHQRETVSEQPIRPPLKSLNKDEFHLCIEQLPTGETYNNVPTMNKTDQKMKSNDHTLK